MQFSNTMSPRWAYLLISFLSVVHKDLAKLRCDGDSLIKKNGKLSKEDIDDLISIDNQSQIKMCLVVLGKNPLETGIAELLWRDLVKVRHKPSMIINNIFYVLLTVVYKTTAM